MREKRARIWQREKWKLDFLHLLVRHDNIPEQEICFLQAKKRLKQIFMWSNFHQLVSGASEVPTRLVEWGCLPSTPSARQHIWIWNSFSEPEASAANHPFQTRRAARQNRFQSFVIGQWEDLKSCCRRSLWKSREDSTMIVSAVIMEMIDWVKGWMESSSLNLHEQLEQWRRAHWNSCRCSWRGQEAAPCAAPNCCRRTN